MGFEIIPYNHCVANMMVNGAKCTVCWHVDDLKVFHMDEAIVTAFSLKLADLCKGRGGLKPLVHAVRGGAGIKPLV